MTAARLIYSHNENPSRGLAAAGLLLVKWILAIPHLIIVSALIYLATVVAYVGYFIVAFTGKMPEGIRTFTTLSLRWSARSYGWLVGYTDLYPPFETEPVGYPVEAEVPSNENPSKGWAVAGIFLVKLLALIPHLIVVYILTVVAVVASWIGYVATAFTGTYPPGIADFVAGVVQWWLRVGAWIYGLTDDYPPFELNARPTV